MEMALLVALGCAVALLLVLMAVLLWTVLAGRRRMQQVLAGSRGEVEALRARLEALSEEIEAARVLAAAAPAVLPAEYLITRAGAAGALEDEFTPASNRAALSVTFGEPLVKAVALAYGVSRALSPQTRNRIVFEMRREVKRARKQHRREFKEARRDANAERRNIESHGNEKRGNENQEDAA